MGSWIKYPFRCRAPLVLLACGLCFAPGTCKGQTYAEFFRQQRTQEKYLLKQLAYLKLYADQAWKGYKLVSGGLETINGFTSGELGLHRGFLSALSKVGPAVGGDYRVAEILAFRLQISRWFSELQQSPALSGSPGQLYYSSVSQKVAEQCDADLEELMDIVLSGSVEMNDAQRLSRLGRIHRAMAEKLEFTKWFCRQALLLVESGRREKSEIEELGRIYEKN